MLQQGKQDCEKQIRNVGQDSGMNQLAAMFAAPGAMAKVTICF